MFFRGAKKLKKEKKKSRLARMARSGAIIRLGPSDLTFIIIRTNNHKVFLFQISHLVRQVCLRGTPGPRRIIVLSVLRHPTLTFIISTINRTTPWAAPMQGGAIFVEAKMVVAVLTILPLL